MKAIRLLTLSLGCAALVGCMHTVIGGNPVRSPDKRYRLGVEIHGASGKAYTALTKKRVYLWLGTNADSNRVGHVDKKYVFTAADLLWQTDWHGSDEVAVHFFDYGDGVYAGDAHKAGTPSNHIATLTFQWDAQAGKFVEKK